MALTYPRNYTTIKTWQWRIIFNNFFFNNSEIKCKTILKYIVYITNKFLFLFFNVIHNLYLFSTRTVYTVKR